MTGDKTLMRNKRNSPLEELLEDEAQITARGEEILKDLIKPYAYIGKAKKSIHLRDKAFDLPARLRVLLLFLTKLAMRHLNLVSDASISQKEAIDFFLPQGMPEGTVKVSLMQLREEKLISKTTKGGYSTGFDKLSKAQTEFNKYGRRATNQR